MSRMMRFLRSLNYAFQGIKYCFISERNFRIELLVALLTIALSAVLKIGTNEWLAVLFCSALVLCLEIINTSIEKLSNVVNASIHPVIKVVKDTAAASVFTASLISLVIAAIIFLPKVEPFIKSFLK